MSDFILGVMAVLLFLLSLFLIFIIMIQRGKGGGIAGSLTGTAQSAFGARGGDLLMWWTIGLTGVWIFLSGITIFFYSSPMDEAQAEDQGGVQDTELQSDVSDNAAEPGGAAEELINNATQDDAPTEDSDSSQPELPPQDEDESDSPENEEAATEESSQQAPETTTDEPKK